MSKENKRILLLPGTGQSFRNYDKYEGLDIWMGDDREIPRDSEIIIGHSLGASFVLSSGIASDKKFIFVNPLIKSRSLASLFVRWIKFHLFEGINKEKIAPMRYWLGIFKRAYFLLRFNAFSQMQKIPKENIFIIRGKKDNFFCDREDVKILIENKFNVFEVDAGHDWNENIAREVSRIISDS